jgi:uncharacterized membrane protein YdjX (TVP38/TMEM64 family)
VKRRIPAWKWGAIGIGVAALAAAAYLLPLADWSIAFEEKLESVGLATGLAIFLAVNVAANLLMVPAWIFPVAAGAAFGLAWGFVAATTAAIVAALAAFLASRHLLRGRLNKYVRDHPTFKAFEKAVSGDGWKVVALMRVSPLFTSGMKSYFFGLTRIKLATYAGASLVGMLPGLALKTFIGAAGRDALERGPFGWAMLGAGIVATVAAAVIVRRLTLRRLGA